MTPRNELLTQGRIGAQGAQALYDAVLVVAIGRNFPPPEGHATWDKDAVHDTAHEFLAGARGMSRLVDLAVKSTDDASFRRLLDAAVLNHLRDLARRTDLGRLVVRVKEFLRGDETFVQVPGLGEYWRLAEGPTSPSVVPVDDIKAALSPIPVTIPRWTSEHRHAPLADHDSLQALIRAALTTAEGALDAADIARALAHRLDHRRVPITVELDVREGVSEPASPGPDPAEKTVFRAEAVRIFDQLSDRERIIVAWLDVPVRELGAMIGAGKSRAATLRSDLLERLRRELAGPDRSGVAGVLTDLCEAWVRSWTDGGDPTSTRTTTTGEGRRIHRD